MEVQNWFFQQSLAITSIYHMGRYCDEWKATTNKYCNPNFHIILDGECWLYLDEFKKTEFIKNGDLIFFFEPLNFYLLSEEKSPKELNYKKMMPLYPSLPHSTGLLCGFLEPNCIQSKLLFKLMPEYLVISTPSISSKKIIKIIDLIKIESESSNLNALKKLTDLLLFYIIESYIQNSTIDINIIEASKNKNIANLIIAILERPNEEWSIEQMAEKLNLSRSATINKIQNITTYTPNELLSRIRINVAIKLFRRGYTIENIYEKVGYKTIQGFYKAFKRITNETPLKFFRCFNLD